MYLEAGIKILIFSFSGLWIFFYCHQNEFFEKSIFIKGASLVAQVVKHLPTMWETQVQSLGQEALLEKETAAHSSILAWKNPMDGGTW